ncbi:MAG: transposase [Anaerolineales bacterium]|nr:transposase [Anaerolineales bacterium]
MTRFANFSKKSEGRGAVCHDRAIESKGLYQRAVCPDSHGKKRLYRRLADKFRNEYLQREWFSSLLDVQVVIAEWRLHYNTQRPHSSVDSQTPMDFAAQIQPAHSLIPVGHKN